MEIETLRYNLAVLLDWDEDYVGNRDLLFTPACHAYNPKEVTEVVIGLRGTSPKNPLLLSGMDRPWDQRELRYIRTGAIGGATNKRNGHTKQMICALIDRLLVATGYEVNWVTPLPPLYALPKTLQLAPVAS